MHLLDISSRVTRQLTVASRRGLSVPVLVLTLALAVAIGAITTLSGASGFGGAAVAAGVLAVGFVAFTRGLEGLTFCLAAAAAFTVSLLGIRVGPITLADTFLVLSVLPIVANLTRDPLQRSQLSKYLSVVALTALTVAGGLGGSFVATDQISSVSELGRFTASSLFLLVVIALWSPAPAKVRMLLWISLVGVCFHVVIGMFIRDGNGRILGLATHPNHLGIASALSVGVALGLMFSTPRTLHKVLGGGALVLLGLGVVMSGSRAAAVGAAACIAIVLVSTRSWRLLAWGSVAVVAAAALVFSGTVDLGDQNALTRLGGDQSSRLSNVERGKAFDQALDSIAENPLTGGGFASAKAAHSIYLQLWVSAGILGLVFIFGVGIVVVRVLLEARAAGDLLSIGLAAGYIGYLVAGIASNQLWDRYIWLHLCLLLALRKGAHEGSDPLPAEPSPASPALTRPA